MRGFQKDDAFPATDYGLKQELKRHPEVDANSIRPWREYAATALWKGFAEAKNTPMSLSYKIVDSPIGKLKLVASAQGLVAILWDNDNPRRVRLTDLAENCSDRILLRTETELNQYFAGKRESFTVPLDMRGTPFQNQVWAALTRYPVWRDADLWTACETAWESSGDTRGGRGQREKPRCGHRALPSCNWVFRKADRIRRRPGSKGAPPESRRSR